MPENYMSEPEMHEHHHHHHHDLPVVIERIMLPYKKPDGSFSHHKYYQYPVTCFDAVHATNDIHSETLSDVLRRVNDRIERRQKRLQAGDPNEILTRGKELGQVGKLTKIDLPDESRRSKNHVPSEYALFKSLDAVFVEAKNLVGEESVRATNAEGDLAKKLQEEVIRAQEAEEKLQSNLDQVAESKLDVTIAGDDGLVIKDIVVNGSDLRNITWAVKKLNLTNGKVDTVNGSANILGPVETMIDDKIKAAEQASTKVDRSIFEDADDKVVVKTEFVPTTGAGIGRLTTTYKDVNGGKPDESSHIIFKTDSLSVTSREMSSTEVEVNLNVQFASDLAVSEMIHRVFA